MSSDKPAADGPWYDGTPGLGVGVAVGVGLGAAVGAVTGDLALWTAVGVALGVVAVAFLQGQSSE